ncbi:TPA: hypothetical protein L4Q96_006743 [Pseudomonas aeruginosa]|nr:hypothetical protein [Pseudomonas aeruginosa]HBO4016467.1 hypothetical protein [Pseudomonas aeruginosa]
MDAYESINAVKGLGLSGGLKQLEIELRSIFKSYWREEVFSYFERECRKLLKEDGTIAEDKILRCWTPDIRQSGSIELKERFFYAMLYHMGAEHEYYKGNHGVAGLLAMRSAHELGRFDGWRACMETINAPYNGRIKGGDTGKAIREEAYLELFRYIQSGPIKEGSTWKSKEDVIRDCEQRLQSYINKKYPLFSFMADNFIDNSLSKKGVVKDAFLSYKKAVKDKVDTDSTPTDQIISQNAKTNDDLTFDQRLSFLQRQHDWVSPANETDSSNEQGAAPDGQP